MIMVAVLNGSITPHPLAYTPDYNFQSSALEYRLALAEDLIVPAATTTLGMFGPNVEPTSSSSVHDLSQESHKWSWR